MFDFFRKHNKAFMVLLVLLIIPSFVLFGVDRYTQGNGTGEAVASVDGRNITRPEWDAQHRIESERVRQQNPTLDPSVLDSEAARYATLENMVRDRVLAAAAAKSRMTISEERLSRIFSDDAGLASFRGSDGKFDRARFMATTGQTPEQYEASVRSQLSTQQVLQGVAVTAFATKTLASTALNAFFDRREIQVARFNAADFASKVTLTDADLEIYFKAHSAEFQAPEHASIEYIVLDLDTVKKTIVLTEAELRKYYDENKERFGTKEERRASHILIAVPQGASAAERNKARATAETLLAEVKKTPADFAAIARKNSQDPGSAEKGGDLDFVTRGAMVKPFDDAMFALKKGGLSDVIESEFGYHIIQLNDIKPSVIPPFEQVHALIDGEIRSQRASDEFAKAADTIKDLVYQQPESLKPAADQLKLTIQVADNVTRAGIVGAKGVLGSRSFLSAVFAPESLDRKHNTEALEIAPNQLASGRVTQYSAARALTFAEVKDQVRARLIAERSSVLAKEDGAAKLTAWSASPAAAGGALAAPVTVSRLELQGLPAPVIEAALRVDTTKLPVLTGVDLGTMGYAIVKVEKIVPRAPQVADAATQENAQFTQSVAAAENSAYYNLLKERFKVKMLVRKPVTGLGIS
jgi:peptidyl-prolyl cis-trans isomerase D